MTHDAFSDELEKIALPKALVRAAPTVLTGGALGGLWQGATGYQQAREQGQDRLQALGQGAVSGARGAAIGAGVGAGIHALSRVPGVIGRYGKSADDTVSNYGRLQAHVITGRGKPRDFGQGSSLTERSRKAALEHLSKVEQAPSPSSEGIGGKLRSWSAGRKLDKARKGVVQAGKEHAAAIRAEDMGLTSIPGTIKALRTHSPGQVARAALDYQWGTVPAASKAFMIGAPLGIGAVTAYQGGAEAAPEVGELAGSAASGLLPHTAPGSLAMAVGPWGRYTPTGLVSMPFEAAGRGAGHLVRRVVKGKEDV